MIRLLLDENFPAASTKLLRAAGLSLDVASMSELAPGSSDAEVLARAVQEGRVVVTFDRDFGSLLFLHSLPPPPAVIYFRLDPRSPEEPGKVLVELLVSSEVKLTGFLTVIERDFVRQRPFPKARE